MGYFFYFTLEFPLGERYRLHTSDSTFVKVEENSEHLLLLLGAMPENERSSLSSLAKKLREDASFWPSLDGRFVFFVLNKTTQQLTSYSDYYGTFPVFSGASSGQLSFSNRPEKLLENRAWTLDKESFYFFLDYGLTPNPRTLIHEVRLASGVHTYDVRNGAVKSARTAQTPGQLPMALPDACSLMFSALEGSIDTIGRLARIDELRLSGGADTRLITLLLSEEKRQGLQFVTVQSPCLEAGEDADVNCAVELASALRLKHRVLAPGRQNFSFFFGLGEKTLMTGLFGGEFLGGEMYPQLPMEENWKLWEIFSGDEEAIGALKRQRIRMAELRADPQSFRAFLVEHMFSAYRSTIYKSVRYSWSAPYVNSQIGISPFTERRFLDAFFQVPGEYFLDYRLYFSVLQKAAGDRIVLPMVSRMTDLFPGLPPPRRGMNSKQIHGSHPVVNSSDLSRARQVFEELSLNSWIDRLDGLMADAEIRLRLENFLDWYDSLTIRSS